MTVPVPPQFRADFEAQWDAWNVESDELKNPYHLFSEVSARLDALAPDAPERAWVSQLMVERVNTYDERRSRAALAFVHRHLVADAIPQIRRHVGWYLTEEPELAAEYLAAADDIAEAAGWPDDEFGRYVPEPTPSVWARRRLRPVEGTLDFHTRRHVSSTFDTIAARGRRAQDPRPAEQALEQWIAEGEPIEQGWIFELLTEWLASRDPWRWHVALTVLERHRVRSSAPALRAAVSPPNTDDKARWAQAFLEAADRLEQPR